MSDGNAAQPYSNRYKTLRSDVRVKGGVVGDCVLCRRNSPLRQSHTVPKWTYRPKTGKGKLLAVHGELKQEVQDGNWHYLLCDDCEEFLGVGENHLATLSRGKPSELAVVGVRVTPGSAPDLASRFVRGADFRLVARALAGILFKCHHAPTSPHVVLPERALDVLREDLLDDRYDESRYAVLVTKCMDYGRTGMNPRGRTGEWWDRPEAPGSLSLMMGGIFWQLHCAFGDAGEPVEHRKSDVPDEYLWSGTDPWRWAVGDVRYLWPMVGPLAFELEHPDDTPAGYPRGAECPCGSGATFEDCCSGTWA